MNIIKNLKIRDKLILLLSLLLLPLIYFVFSTIRVELQENELLKQEVIQLEESEKISELLHSFQRERARILAAAAGNRQYILEAVTQRNLTDAAENDLKAFLLSSGRSLPELAALNELKKHRSNLDNKSLNVQEFREYSTMLVFSLLDKIESNATGITNPAIARQLVSFKNLAEAKIQLGRIRSLLMLVLQDNSFTVRDYAAISNQIMSLERALQGYYQFADQQSVSEMQATISSENYRQVTDIIDQIRKDPNIELRTFSPATTFNLFTKGIEDFRKTERNLVKDIKSRVQAESNQKKQNLLILMVITFLLIGLTALLSFYIISIIATSLSALKTAADRIKLGATDVVIDIDSTDEIGSVAESFRGVLEKNILLSNVARAIGEGSYEVEVVPQSDEDILSYSIKSMKENLQTFTTESEERNWVLTGVSELNNQVGGENSLESITTKIVSFVCDYAGAEAGILYLHNNIGKLEPAAAFGVQQPLEQLPHFALGTGKVGQAVSDNKIQVLEAVAEEYLRIKTGLADIAPASIIIIPLYFADTIIGALELSTRKPYNEVQQRFFNSVSDRISVVIYTLKSHVQTQELLYETQNLAEELETQQEELRQVNSELRASEEELRVNQEELQEKNTELEEKAQLLEEQYEALRNKNKAIEDAREAIELKIQQVETVSKYKSDFLSNMSHELRTPLNSILILSRLLADNAENTLSTKQRDHAQIIHKSGNDLLKLINEILDLSKIESGMIRLETDEVKLDSITLEPIFREVATKKNIRYSERHIPASFDTIITDRFRLEQILKNFIGNALKFTSDGGEVELAVYPVTTKPNFASAHLREQTDIIAFSVRDTGIGIPADKQHLVFEAFQQADTSTTRKYGGTGLGLTISRELAAILGGELMLESEPGKGSTFTVYLPRVASNQPAKPNLAQPSMVASQHKADSMQQLISEMKPGNNAEVSILIVEDDKGFNDILADFATAKGFKVYQAYTGKTGLELAHQHKPNAMLLDIQLPDMMGWDVLQEIRKDKVLRATNVHVMSAYDKEVIQGASDNEEYMPKPVTLEMLNKAFLTFSETTEAPLENILIVEDNEVENRAVAELLLAHNLKSTSAFSAEEAEQVLAKHKVDCIILDLNLPGMKGYDWMKKIRSSEGLSDIPIIIYSGKDLSEEEETSLKEFTNTIIIKNEYSYLRLLDEVQLFLHKVNQKLPQGNAFRMKLHVPEEVLQGKKVLVADDDVRNIYSLSSLLELHGMEVVTAGNGEEALRKLETEKGIDMVLMDVMMPEMDGIEATKQIRSKMRFSQLPIIALTAKAMKEDKEKCLAAGASDYITKPVDTDKLLTLMRVWLYEA